MRKPTEEDMRKVREFQAILMLPTVRERRMALLMQLPDSTDEADCVCEALKDCTETDNPCPHCRTIDPYDACPQIGYGCGLLGDECDCCTPGQRKAAAR